jgi:hypothetical protein
MAWTYFLASEDLPSDSRLGSVPLPTARLIPSAKECCYLECLMEVFRLAPSGTISKRWREANLEELSILCMEDFPARTSAVRAMEKAWQESEADCFSRSFAWPKKSSPLSYSLRTSQPSPAEEESESLEKLPRWGMTVDGALYPLRPLERGIEESGISYWPTPRAVMTGNLSPNRCNDKFPNLETVMSQRMWPTPKASDGKRGGKFDESKRHCASLPATVKEKTGYRMNLPWLEWLMMYPIGWTELKPWAMQWFRDRRKRRSKS